jgi:DNA polymerase elongation subunit (family B)
MSKYQTKTVEDTEMVYSILREKYRDRQIEIEFNDNTKEYTLNVTNEKFHEDPEVPVDLKIKVIYGDTDSVFLSMKFNRENFELNRKDAFKMGIICGDNLTEQIFKRPPIELEFEKVYQPFILLTKKRYIGKKFEDTRDPLKLKTVTTAGIALTRRNYSQLVKKCYKEVIDCILDTGDLQKSCDIYKNYIEQIEKYNVDFEDLVVSAQIGKEYACKECKKKVEWVLRCKNFTKGKLCNESNPHKKSHCDKCKQPFECVHSFSLAHINLAQKLLERNEDIQVGDRIQYIFVEGIAKEQKNELAEDYNYALKHSLKFNRVSYLEQVAKPVLGFLKVCLDNTPDLLDGIIDYTNEKMVQFGGKKLRVSDFKINEDD